MRIAIVGIRGIPGRYGGFETFVEQLGPALVKAGHSVEVFNRPQYRWEQPTYRGVTIRTVATVQNKFLDTLVHTLLSLVIITFRRELPEVVLICNVGNSPLAWLPRVRRIPVVLNVDGLEWQRRKWPAIAKWYLLACERLAPWTANALVTDAHVIRRYYLSRYHVTTEMIPYGAHVETTVGPNDEKFLASMGLRPKKYFLYVSRLEPENNADMVVDAFQRAGEGLLDDLRLAVVGDAPYASRYKARLQRLINGSPRIVQPGGIYGEGYQILQRNALAYVHATSVGGTHPALVEGMAHGAVVLVYETVENIEVAGDCALVFRDAASLADAMIRIGKTPTLFDGYRKRAIEHVTATYSWGRIAQQYESLFLSLTRQKMRFDGRIPPGFIEGSVLGRTGDGRLD